VTWSPLHSNVNW